MKRTHSTIAALSIGAAGLIAPVVGGGSAADAAPSFKTPLPCNYSANANMRANHSPANAVDYQSGGSEINGKSALAAAGGEVTRVENEGSTSYGKWVEIKHSDGYTTRYAHLSSQSVKVKDKVKTGDKIGVVGSTGGSTGPHLHFEVRSGGTAIKPTVDGKALTNGDTAVTSKNCGGDDGGGDTSYPGADAFKIGKSHPAVKKLDKALIKKGYDKHHDGDGYQAGTTFTKFTKQNVQDFQKAQGWTGADADGYPGPETWKRLVG